MGPSRGRIVTETIPETFQDDRLEAIDDGRGTASMSLRCTHWVAVLHSELKRMATIRYVSVILILVLLRPVTLVGQDDSYFALRLTDGETLEFPSVAFFQESEDGGTKAICITPQGNGPGLVLIASFDFASIPTVVEEDAVTVLLGTTDPTLGLYGADDSPNWLVLKSFSDGMLSGSYTGTVRGIGMGPVVADIWVRSSFVASQVTDESCSQPVNR